MIQNIHLMRLIGMRPAGGRSADRGRRLQAAEPGRRGRGGVALGADGVREAERSLLLLRQAAGLLHERAVLPES